MPDPTLERGWIAHELAQEFPELGLAYLTVEASPGRSPEPVRERLDRLASRMTGGHVVHMRQDAVPWAYRVFWRQVGLDPDLHPTPVEELALERLKAGGLPSRNLVDDAIRIATLETSVPVLAFDADRVGAHIGLRLTGAEESLGVSRRLPADQIVVSDEHRALALLGGEADEARGVTPSTRRMTIAAFRVRGVPKMSLEEALWTMADLLTGGT